jgi:GTPase Era involved in 16S rRNA processing
MTYIEYKKAGYTIYDIGGYKEEREKWETLEGIDCVVYMVSLSDFYKESDEEGMGRLELSLDCFKRILKFKKFVNTKYVVLFNKYDKFCEKIKKYKFSHYHKNYLGFDYF